MPSEVKPAADARRSQSPTALPGRRAHPALGAGRDEFCTFRLREVSITTVGNSAHG